MSACHVRLVVPTSDCSTERVAQMAGLLAHAVMMNEVSLGDHPACCRLLRDQWFIGFSTEDMDDVFEAKCAAIHMIEDRARRATAFREPRR